MNITKLKKFLKSLENDEIIEIYKTLTTSKDLIINEIKEEIIERNLKEHKICSVCGTPLSTDYFELIFDRIGFRKRAYFCGKDCLIYFLNSLDKKGEESTEKREGECLESSVNSKTNILEKNIKQASDLKDKQLKIKKSDKRHRTINHLAQRLINLFF